MADARRRRSCMGDKVILNTLLLAWGDLNRPGNRYMAFDKRTGQTIWMSSPQARHYDTNYSTPIVANIDGVDALVVGGTDGSFHALKVNTGEPIWRVDVSKRAILNSVLYRDGVVYLTHGEENIGTTEMGMIAALDARRKGDLKDDAFKWKTLGFLPTYASPVMDNERLYTVDNSAIVAGVRPAERQAAVGARSRHAAEGIAAARRWQALRRHREWPLLHPEAVGDRRRGARRGVARFAGDAGSDRRVADCRGRPHLRDVDGRDVRDRQAQSSGWREACGGRAKARPHCRAGHQRMCRSFRTSRCSRRVRSRRSSFGSLTPAVVLIREEKAGAATWALDQLAGTVARRRVHVAGDRFRRLRQSHGRRRDRHGARPRDSAAAVDLRLRKRSGGSGRWGETRCCRRGAADVVDRRAHQSVPADGGERRQGAGAAA